MAESARERPRVMVLGVGAFSQAVLQILKDDGAEVSTYLTRDYAHFSPSLAGATYDRVSHPNPCEIIRKNGIDLLIPMSIDWRQSSWADELLACGVAILSPVGEAMRIEKEREFAHQLCEQTGIPFPESHVVHNQEAAQKLVLEKKRPFVIKNPYCSPTSPLHTIICETHEDTLGWLSRLDYAEGAFLQEYAGGREVGHIAFVSDGEIFSLVTNQEYKRAFDGNMGIIAGAPLGGLVEADPGDKYGLAAELLQPLKPWFRKTAYHGPIQVTAALHNGKWHVLEYNIRLGVTCAAMILRLLKNPLDCLLAVAQNRRPAIAFKANWRFGCSLTLAGIGYPYIAITAPQLPVRVLSEFDCDVWWNEVALNEQQEMVMTGHRLADVVAFGETLEDAKKAAYRNIKKIKCLSSYYRTDIGESMWPPGSP